jgi:hypothetical protein
MIKFTAAFDGLKYSESTEKYSTFFAQQAQAHLVGIFLDDFSYHSYRMADLLDEKKKMDKRLKDFEKKDKETRDRAAQQFEMACKRANLEYTIHHDRSIAIHELLHESIYADLLVIDSKETFTNFKEDPPTHFIRDMLAEVQCPALVVPQQYRPPEKIILLYDGGPSSVFAIKMFSYLFPSLKTLETEVISVNSDKVELHIPDIKLMKEFMQRHFPGAKYKMMKGYPEAEILQYVKKQNRNAMVVLGAYRRGMVSRWFRASMADALMRHAKLPLFIAHNK